MESFGSSDTSQGAGSEVKAYIEQEWTSEGFYCRSENPETGMFEIVLPQISKDFGPFMQDLLVGIFFLIFACPFSPKNIGLTPAAPRPRFFLQACGIGDVEFRADTKETRLLVYVTESTVIPEYFRQKKTTRLWKMAAIAIFLLMAILVATLLKTAGEKEL